ncbi:protein lifeguard 1 [Alligator sinensis]|uniref:Protein lifeguard 1 n=1 Tax=Alligator sinensis TaxID=38654 RepID=A0A1U8DSZ4_ALLSI|nr:protein lifeguard 1 [Alligator sinensis]XP_014380819.1 protein lifeguard 1 [Alligator sinensis]XP_014380820.1 protein lifeguard 1 [Alligator sinensis]XP_025046853.1 protein lifeguard 1 [Alligator sinensis]XP_025046854.1 protein lifeguard 1 [Alligator sinensis]
MERNESSNYPGAAGESPFNKNQYQGRGVPPAQYWVQSHPPANPSPYVLNVENPDLPPPAYQHQAAGEGMPNDCLAAAHDKPPAYQSPMEESSQFSDKAIRQAFVRKVYLILTVQLAVTVGIICMFIYWRRLKVWIWMNPWFTYALFPAILILAIVLACCDNARRKFPLNLILLAIFTVLEGLMLGSISALFYADAVMWAIGATTFVTLGLSVFALQTKWDFTIASGILLAVVLVLMAFGILCAIIRSFWLQIVYASIGTLVFSIYLVVDTQLMLGGKHRYCLNPEEYVFAALNLYLDILNIFLFILQLIGLSR